MLNTDMDRDKREISFLRSNLPAETRLTESRVGLKTLTNILTNNTWRYILIYLNSTEF